MGPLLYSKALDDAGVNPILIIGFNTMAGVSGGTYSQNPNLTLFTGATQTGALFTDPKLSTFFTTTTYRGAFGSNDWTDCWANFNTQNLEY